jgi:hypothetical protein
MKTITEHNKTPCEQEEPEANRKNMKIGHGVVPPRTVIESNAIFS